MVSLEMAVSVRVAGYVTMGPGIYEVTVLVVIIVITDCGDPGGCETAVIVLVVILVIVDV
jgi:hypothetical protein